MNINFDIKNLLAFFKRTTFRIAFMVGIIIYKFCQLETKNEIINNVVNIILVISIIFVLDDILEKIFKPIKVRITLNDYIKELKNLSEPQVLILIYHYFNFDEDKLIVNQTSYFNLHEGEYQILVSKLILFRAASTASSFNFPFSIQDWAYKEIIKAIDNKEIEINKLKNEYIVKWYKKEYRFNKEELDDMQQTLEDMSWL